MDRASLGVDYANVRRDRPVSTTVVASTSMAAMRERPVMEDPQVKESMDPSKMPFDGKRMFWGGFQSIIGLSGGQ